MRALAGREDVFAEIESIDVGPYSESSPFRLCIREAGVTVDVGMGIFENSFPQREEPIDIPLFDVLFIGVDVNRKIEEVGNESPRRSLTAVAGLQDVQTFDDNDVRLANGLHYTGNDVVPLVRIDRDACFRQS